MFGRNCLMALGLIVLVPAFTGCSNTEVGYIQISPATQSLAGGQTVQFVATGIVGHGSHPASSQDVTNQVTWTSGTPAVATVSATGLATAVSTGTTTISANMSGSTGATATITVTSGSGGTGGETLASLSIIPGSQSVASPGQTSQFIAVGTTVSGSTQNLTATATWLSSSAQVATISPGGLATGLSKGTTTITAIATNPNNTVVTGTATFTVVGGASEPFTALSISPSAQSLSATGQTGQFFALGTSGITSLDEDVTNSAHVMWSSSIPTIATVSTYPATPAGLAAGVSAGTTTITAKLTNPDESVLTSSATVTVSATAAPEPLLSIVVLPSSITINDLLGTGQFLAYGTFSTAPTVMDITNGINHNGFVSPVTWVSTAQTVFPINSSGAPGSTGGLVTAVGSGSDDIYAVATNADGTLVYSPPVTFNCPYVAYVPANPSATPPTLEVLGSCNAHTIAPGLLVTLTVFNAGLNTTNWLVKADSATGTKDVIHCGGSDEVNAPGGSVCTATYPLGTRVTLTATQPPGNVGTFGGWSWNCKTINPNPSTAIGPNTCTVRLGIANSSNVSVGAIFN
jgi:hypothetical protein